MGWANEVILPDLVDRLGRFRDFEMESGDDGVQRMSYWFEIDGERVPFHSIQVEGHLFGASTAALDRLVGARR